MLRRVTIVICVLVALILGSMAAFNIFGGSEGEPQVAETPAEETPVAAMEPSEMAPAPMETEGQMALPDAMVPSAMDEAEPELPSALTDMPEPPVIEEVESPTEDVAEAEEAPAIPPIPGSPEARAAAAEQGGETVVAEVETPAEQAVVAEGETKAEPEEVASSETAEPTMETEPKPEAAPAVEETEEPAAETKSETKTEEPVAAEPEKVEEPAPAPAEPTAQPAQTSSSSSIMATQAEILAERQIGSDNAPVIMYDYASLTCPHCAQFHIDTFEKLKAEYVDTGKVKVIMRDFPTSAVATQAAMLTRCVTPAKYWQFLQALYKTQGDWLIKPEPFPHIRALAKQLGMTDAEMDQCLDNDLLLKTIASRVQSSQQEYKINSTPSFVITKAGSDQVDVIVGNKAYSEFQKVLNAHVGQ